MNQVNQQIRRRRVILASIGSITSLAGCISFGSKSQGVLKVSNDLGRESRIICEVTGYSGEVLSERRVLNPGATATFHFPLEEETSYDIRVNFDTTVQEAEFEQGIDTEIWSLRGSELEGIVNYSSENQVYNISIKSGGLIQVSYSSAGVP